MDHANAIIQIPGFSRAPYVGHKGWITIDPSLVKDWKTVQELIGESYRLIAPKRSLDKLPDGSRAAKGLV
jgi:predicted DNA-binding protein (MmcQ/YjbR family)